VPLNHLVVVVDMLFECEGSVPAPLADLGGGRVCGKGAGKKHHVAALMAARAVATTQPLGPLHGVPVAVKDLFDLKQGVRNTFGSVPLAEFVADRTSLHVERLERAGAIIVGKTNTPEFGHKG